jgi:hypothetical protein
VAKDQPAGSRSRRRQVAIAAVAIVALAAAYIGIPRHADLTKFDPGAMARLETSMWRQYYDKRYLSLFGDLYEVARSEYGFSPLDSLRLAVAAATAAKAFQPSTSRVEAEAALPSLVDYFFSHSVAGGSNAHRGRGCGPHRACLVAGAARGGLARAIRADHRARRHPGVRGRW